MAYVWIFEASSSLLFVFQAPYSLQGTILSSYKVKKESKMPLHRDCKSNLHIESKSADMFLFTHP
jgi:hypothetical protein